MYKILVTCRGPVLGLQRSFLKRNGEESVYETEKGAKIALARLRKQESKKLAGPSITYTIKEIQY